MNLNRSTRQSCTHTPNMCVCPPCNTSFVCLFLSFVSRRPASRKNTEPAATYLVPRVRKIAVWKHLVNPNINKETRLLLAADLCSSLLCSLFAVVFIPLSCFPFGRACVNVLEIDTTWVRFFNGTGLARHLSLLLSFSFNARYIASQTWMLGKSTGFVR